MGGGGRVLGAMFQVTLEVCRVVNYEASRVTRWEGCGAMGNSRNGGGKGSRLLLPVYY